MNAVLAEWLPRIGRRLLVVAGTMMFVVTVCFFLVRLAPGDIVDVRGSYEGATAEEMQAERIRLGLDRPLIVQFGGFLAKLATLDLGYSEQFSAPVLNLIVSKIPATLLLMLASLCLALLVGVLAGSIASQRPGGVVDTIISGMSMVSLSVPLFWLGLMLIVLFSIRLRLLPAGGMFDLYSQHTGWAYVRDVATHIILPAVTLAVHYAGVFARLTREAMLEIRGLDFIRNAHAKGLRPLRVQFRYVLRNALLPIVTMTGLQLGTLLGGSVVIETIFAWPGIGRLTYDAMLSRDLDLLMGILLFSSLLVIVANLLTDMIYAMLDPRIRLKENS